MTGSYKVRQGYGWRGKVGLLVPSINFAMEYEFNKMAPRGVLVCAARLKVKGNLANAKSVLLMNREIENKAKEVADAKVDVIVYGCTSGSFIGGSGYDKELISNIENLTNIPAITTSTSVIEALKELEIKNVALVTPYREEINRLEEDFLQSNGFSVSEVLGGILRSDQMLPSVAYERAKNAHLTGVEGIFISCTNFQTINIIEQIESNFGKPVISSNQATMWNTLKKLQIPDALIGYGSLLKRHR